jgi:hypothetical protein
MKIEQKAVHPDWTWNPLKGEYERVPWAVSKNFIDMKKETPDIVATIERAVNKKGKGGRR